jgi:hypothetical protein
MLKETRSKCLALYPHNFLLDVPSVQQDLQLNPDELLRVAKIREKYRASLQILTKETRDKTQELRIEKAEQAIINAEVEKSTAVQRVMLANLDRELIEALDRKARDRLKEIRIQVEGPMAFTRQEVQREIGIQPARIVAIEDIVDEGREEIIRTTPTPTALTREGGQAQQDRLHGAVQTARRVRESLIKKITSILDENQNRAYQDMLGKPFDLTTLPPARVGPKT